MGMETPTSAKMVAMPSIAVFLWVADSTPSAIPATAAITMATKASSTVAGKRAMSSCSTGVCV